GDGPVEVLLVAQGYTQAAVGGGQRGVQLDGLAELGDGAVEVLLGVQSAAEVLRGQGPFAGTFLLPEGLPLGEAEGPGNCGGGGHEADSCYAGDRLVPFRDRGGGKQHGVSPPSREGLPGAERPL